MRLGAFIVALAIALLGRSEFARAETRLLEVPTRYLMVPPMDGGEKHVNKSEAVFEFPLRWREAAILSEQVRVTADEQVTLIKNSQALVRTKLQFDAPEFAGADSFCIPRKAAPVGDRVGAAWLGNLGLKLVRSATDGQFCLVDQDHDRSFDHSVLVNDGSPGARTPQPIQPVAYEVQAGAPVWEGDKVRILYRGKYRFELEIVEQDVVRKFDYFSVTLPDGRHEYWREARVLKSPDGSYSVGVPGIHLTATSYDKVSESVLVRWPTTAKPTIIPVPEDIKLTYGRRY